MALACVFLITLTSLIAPSIRKECKSSVSDMLINGNTVLLSTDNGWIQRFQVDNGKLISEFKLPSILISGNKKEAPFIYSFDESSSKKTMVIASQGKNNFCNLYIRQNGKLSLLMQDMKAKLLIKKVRFLTNDKILIATLSNDLIIYSILQRKQLKIVHHGNSPFTDFAFNENKSKLVSTDESGVIRIFDVNLKLLKEIKHVHNDEVFQVDYKKGKIACASKDQSVSVISESGFLIWKKETEFFAYNIALSQDATKVAIVASFDHKIEVYKLTSQQSIQEFDGHKAMLTRMNFYKNTIVSAGDDAGLCFWKLN